MVLKIEAIKRANSFKDECMQTCANITSGERYGAESDHITMADAPQYTFNFSVVISLEIYLLREREKKKKKSLV